jgi:ketosteroid isomerase-like protein
MKIGLLPLAILAIVTSSAAAQRTQVEQLELAERDFQRATLEKGVEGWNSFFADSGAQLQNTSHIVRGHAAIRELMGEFLASKTDRLIWWPVSSEISTSGDMAYTFGASGVVSVDSTGALSIAGRGTYLTVWRRDARGNWKVTADMGGQASARALERAADANAAQEIQGIERVRVGAIERRNVPALERIYSHDFLGITANGGVIDRSALFRGLRGVDQGFRYNSFVSNVSVAGETGIVTGVLHTIFDNLAQRQTDVSFLHIYVRRGGTWVFVRELTNPVKK